MWVSNKPFNVVLNINFDMLTANFKDIILLSMETILVYLDKINLFMYK